MRKVVVTEQVSLDGVVQAPASPDEDRRGGFEHGGWYLPYFDDITMSIAADGITQTDAYLFGRRTYQTMASYWPHAPEGEPFADTLNSLPKYVASATLEEPLAWRNSTLLKGEVPDAVAALKRAPGKNIAVLGSSQLVSTLFEHDLVDEVALMIAPVVLGTGKRLFEDWNEKVPLELVDSQTTGTGVIVATYRPQQR